MSVGRVLYIIIFEKQCSSFVLFSLGSVLDMLHAASLTRQLLERGSDALSAIRTSLKQVYLRNQVSEQSKQVSPFCMMFKTYT